MKYRVELPNGDLADAEVEVSYLDREIEGQSCPLVHRFKVVGVFAEDGTRLADAWFPDVENYIHLSWDTFEAKALALYESPRDAAADDHRD